MPKQAAENTIKSKPKTFRKIELPTDSLGKNLSKILDVKMQPIPAQNIARLIKMNNP